VLEYQKHVQMHANVSRGRGHSNFKSPTFKNIVIVATHMTGSEMLRNVQWGNFTFIQITRYFIQMFPK